MFFHAPECYMTAASIMGKENEHRAGKSTTIR